MPQPVTYTATLELIYPNKSPSNENLHIVYRHSTGEDPAPAKLAASCGDFIIFADGVDAGGKASVHFSPFAKAIECNGGKHKIRASADSKSYSFHFTYKMSPQSDPPGQSFDPPGEIQID